MSIRFRFFVILIALSVTANCLFGQNDLDTCGQIRLKFDHINIQDGLSQNIVYSIYQDSRGFMWFGTADGLNRYDGYDFVIFKPNMNDTFGISDNRIKDICEDKYGNLWVATLNGLNLFVRNQEKFVRFYAEDNNKNSLTHNAVRVLYYDREKNTVWAGTDNGLNRIVLRFPEKEENKDFFNTANYRFFQYKNEQDNEKSLSNSTVISIAKDAQNRLWFGTKGNGANIYNPEKDNFIRFNATQQPSGELATKYIWSMFTAPNGNLMLGTGESLDILYFNKKNNHLIPDSLSRKKICAENSDYKRLNLILSICQSNDSSYWIGTYGGLAKFDLTTQRFDLVLNEYEKEHPLARIKVWTVFEDKSHIVWVGTENGIYKFDEYKEKFRHYMSDQSKNKYNLTSNYIRGITSDTHGKFWIATNGNGFFSMIKKGEKLVFDKHYKHNPADTNSLSNDFVKNIFVDSKGKIWLSTWGNGFDIFDEKQQTFRHYQFDEENKKSMNQNYVYEIIEDNQGIIWIASLGGLIRFNPDNEKIKVYKNEPDNPESLSYNATWSVYQGRGGNLWIGTNGGGFNRFNPETGKFTRFVHHHENPKSLSNNNVICFHQSENGDMWIGTYGGGLNKINAGQLNKSPCDIEFEHFMESQGLPSNVVYSILEDNNGFFWMSTNKGISKFNPQTGTFKNYNVDDGLQSNEFNKGAFYKTEDGFMLLGGVNGFNTFYPDKIKDNPFAPDMAITKFQVFNKPIYPGYAGDALLNKTISETKHLYLTHREYVFSFEFTALHYSNPENNRFAYMLEGFDKDWIYCGKRRFVSYTNLPSGDYTFRVKGANSDGVWSKKPASIKIHIAPPFWRTVWFFLLLAVVILAISVTVNRYVLKVKTAKILSEKNAQLESANIKLKELNATKDKFFSIIAHDLINPFNSLLGFSDILYQDFDAHSEDEKYEYIKQINVSANHLYDLLENLLQWARAQTGRMTYHPKVFDINEPLEKSLFLLELDAKKKHIRIVNKIEKKIKIYADLNMINTVIRNIINNAIKFTPQKGEICISAKQTNPEIVIIQISDTGIGIDKDDMDKLFDFNYSHSKTGTDSEKGTGLGLILCKEFVEKNGGKIWVESQKGKGSTFSFELKTAR